MISKMTAAILLTSFTVSSPVSAAAYVFSYNVTTGPVTGSFTTNDVVDVNGFSKITALSGSHAGLPITFLPAGTDYNGTATDNLINLSSNIFSANGLAYSTTGRVYLAFSRTDFFGNLINLEAFHRTDGSFGDITDGSQIHDLVITKSPNQVPSVPEPATWMMMVVGFSFVGVVLRSKLNRLAFIR